MPGFVHHQKFTRVFAAAIVGGLIIFFFLASRRPAVQADPKKFGVTFSTKYAAEIGIDWKAAYLAVLDELGARKLRIPVYWDEVEKSRGEFDGSEVDWMLEQAASRGAEVTLVIGRKTPRWPECHVPGWAKGLTPAEQNERVLKLVEEEVRRFGAFPAVRRWQVENEPLFHFGVCPPPDRKFLKAEVALVRSLDSRPVMLTDSGELSSWLGTAGLADVLGISLYRTVWNKYVGFWYWPLSSGYYAERILLVSPLVKRVIISELQAEPWFSKPFIETPLEEQYASMDPERFRSNVEFAERTGVSEIYLWGAEWWYWLRWRGDPAFWDAAKKLFS